MGALMGLVVARDQGGQRMEPCEFCRHGWHGLECRETTGPPLNQPMPMWPSLRGRRCECPSSFVEPPC